MTERVHDASLQVQVKDSNSVRDEKDSGYEDFPEFNEDECLDSDMEGSTLRRSRPNQPTRAPTLPQRSEKRTSKLDNIMLELKSLDGSQQKDLDKTSVVQESDPHELYLSSEEDASLSDDYDDSLLDLNLDAMDNEMVGEERESSLRTPSRGSQDTARVVSMTFVKPQIITIVSTSNSTTNSPTKARSSVDLEEKRPSTTSPFSSPDPSKQEEQQPSPIKRRPKSIHRMSISSIASLAYSSSSSNAPTAQSPTQLPPRKSSRLAALTSLVTGKPSPTSHAFLNTDPFPTQQPEQLEPEAETPKTPVSALKKGLTRGLARRNPSMQRLSEVYAAQNTSRASLSLRESTDSPGLGPVKEVKKSKPEGPVRYEDIMKSVVRAPPPLPLSPMARTASIFSARRKSLSMRY
jgi:hypothetical protein